ncbi:MAG: alkaline phosphatase family protein, partial [Candidatus Acidiferrales bacterium]
MKLKHVVSQSLHSLRFGVAAIALFQFTVGGPLASSVQAQNAGNNTTTPIKHVIVIIGENRSFDHVFATYKPKAGQTVSNLLSEGIVNADGTPGPQFQKAQQLQANTAGDPFRLYPPNQAPFPNNTLPAPLTGGPTNPYVPNLSEAKLDENGLAPNYYQYLVTGGTGLPSRVPDTRIDSVNTLPAGPFQLTHGLSYDDYAASPVHRFYQMWEQMDCNLGQKCTSNLFSWVEVTEGAGANGIAQPANFSTNYAVGKVTTGEGSTALGFYNVQQGDAPYFKYLADNYAMSDNFHQSVAGGTGANHIMLGHGDAIWFSDGDGHPAKPPHNQLVAAGSANAGTVDEIENPNAAPGTNNWYTEDGYGGGSFGSPSYGGGSYSDCGDANQVGAAAVVKYLQSLPKPVNPRCEPGHYYL